MARKITILEILATIAAIIRILVFDVPSFAVSIAFGSVRPDVPIPVLLRVFFVRRITVLFPLKVIRYVGDLGLPERIFNSTRYGQGFEENLFSEVSVSSSHSDIAFSGRWIIRNSFKDPPLDPSKSDVVVFFLHGGGYCSSSPATYLLFLLRLAEVVMPEKGLSIFALDYDLAPEARFPQQMKQARAAYEWLLSEEVGVSSEKILVMGDSAGGHLALSLLVDLWKPKDESVKPIVSKPGVGVMLLSPWLSLYHKSDSTTRNELTDVFTGSFLDRMALRFAGPDLIRSRSPYLEFLDPSPGIDWDAVLPEWVWVSAGKNEILYDDIVRWIVERGGDCKGKNRICGEIDRDEAHDYAWLATTDAVVRNKFIGTPLSDPVGIEEYAAIDRIGKAILERLDGITK